MSSNLHPACFVAPDWIEALLQEYDKEVKEETTWPVLLLQSSSRKLVWYLCNLFGLSNKGIPGSACRLMERYLSRHLRNYLQVDRANEEWERYRPMLQSKYYLLAACCIQLAAKMTDISSQLTASSVRLTLLRQGIVHSKKEIVQMEFDVYQTLDFRIPLWTALEVAQFFAIHVGIRNTKIMEAVAFIIDLSEFHRNLLEFHIRCWNEMFDTPKSSSSNAYRATLHTLHICAGSVSAASRLMRVSTDLEPSLAAITRTTPAYIKAITDIILNHVIPGK